MKGKSSLKRYVKEMDFDFLEVCMGYLSEGNRSLSRLPYESCFDK